MKVVKTTDVEITLDEVREFDEFAWIDNVRVSLAYGVANPNEDPELPLPGNQEDARGGDRLKTGLPVPTPFPVAPDGAVYLGSSRITMDTIVTWFKRGIPAEEIGVDCRDLSRADVQAVMDYYHQHSDAVDAYLAQRQGEAKKKCPPNTAMMQALEEIRALRNGINPKKDTRNYLREGRAGAMYGYGDRD